MNKVKQSLSPGPENDARTFLEREREYLQKWIHGGLKFHWAIIHKNQPANSIVESRSVARASMFVKKRKVLPLEYEIGTKYLEKGLGKLRQANRIKKNESEE